MTHTAPGTFINIVEGMNELPMLDFPSILTLINYLLICTALKRNLIHVLSFSSQNNCQIGDSIPLSLCPPHLVILWNMKLGEFKELEVT